MKGYGVIDGEKIFAKIVDLRNNKSNCKITINGGCKMKSQKDYILAYLKSGQKLTALDALQKFGVMALSQRIGELKRSGEPIRSKFIKLPSGKTVAQYWYYKEL